MNEMKTRTVNLAEIAVVVEEHVSTSDDLSSDVLPANAARQRAQSMGTLTCEVGDVRVIVCTPPEASAHSDSIVALLTETLGATFETNGVDLDALPDPAVISVTAQGADVALIYVSEAGKYTQRSAGGDGLLGIGVLRHVPLEVAAELGRARITMEEILQYGPGSILELDRTAGSPVDVVVNGSMIARGEVVVLGEEYGIRITEILGRN